MKRKMPYLFFIFLIIIVLVSCKSAEPPQEAPEVQAAQDASVYNTTAEYGELDAILDNTGPLLAYIRFPRTGNVSDYVIEEWARNMYETAQDEINAMRKTDPSVEGELNIQFDSYMVEDKYVGIVAKGMFTNSHSVRSEDVLRTFNLDTERDVFLDNSEILDPAQYGAVISLLYQKLLDAYPDEAGYLKMNESWLKNLAISRDGIVVLFERGEVLPTVFGMLSVTLPYSELGPALRLPLLPVLVSSELLFAQDPPLVPATSMPPQSGEIDPSKPMVALTFDDGPSKHTERILDVLEKHGGRATFCVLGNLAENRRDTVKRAFDMECEIVGHSWNHLDFTKLTEQEIKTQIIDTNNTIEAITGVMPQMYRPPYGAINDKVRNASSSLGIAILYWSVDPKDWKNRNADSVYSAIMNNVKDRSIILSHDLYASTADAMERVIPELISQGYQLVTVSELMYYSDIAIEAGKVYYRGN